MSRLMRSLESASGAVPFVVLVKRVRLSVVVGWIGMLLGGFKIEQTGDFYGEGILVGLMD